MYQKLKGLFFEATSAELKAKLQELNIDPAGMSVDQMEDRLAKAYWDSTHPGEPFPDQYSPMLAHDATKKGSDWIKKNVSKNTHFIQTKSNGMRSLLQIGPGLFKMTARDKSVKDLMYTSHHEKPLGFQNIKNPFSGKTVLDGELMPPVAELDTGKTKTGSTLQAVVALVHMNTPDSHKLQGAVGSLQYHAFDILFFDGQDMRDKPYEERINTLAAASKMLKDENPDLPLFVMPVVTDYDDVEAIYRDHVDRGEEGIMLKYRKGKYATGKRSSDILKYKRDFTIDGWISGATESSEDRGNKDLIGGFEISVYLDEVPHVIAAISNIDNKTRKDATVLTDGRPSLNPAFLDKVVQIVGMDINKNNKLTHARIDEWREDKSKEQCRYTQKDLKP